MLKGLPGIRHLTQLLGIARRQGEIVESLAERSDPQHAYRLISLMIDDYINRYLWQDERYAEPRRLNRFEYQVFSQSGEDGIIDEIFKRIGTTNRHFVEFGVENGLETNTTNLLVKGWRGCWIEAGSAACAAIRSSFDMLLSDARLQLIESFITAENIQSLRSEREGAARAGPPLDHIDGNDYWVWKAIVDYRPRAVVIEYNGIFRPDTEWIMVYDPTTTWNRTTHHQRASDPGPSPRATKAIPWSGANFIGVNAFFVRDDLVGDAFDAPFSPEHHFEPPRYFLWRKTGHPRGFGGFTTDTLARIIHE